jgi:hypothetical protein
VVQLRRHRPQARLDVAEAFAKRELREGQAQELVATRESTQATIALVPADAGVKLAARQKTHQLRKHEMPFEHKTSSASTARKSCPRKASSVLDDSDRVQAFRIATGCSRKLY